MSMICILKKYYSRLQFCQIDSLPSRNIRNQEERKLNKKLISWFTMTTPTRAKSVLIFTSLPRRRLESQEALPLQVLKIEKWERKTHYHENQFRLRNGSQKRLKTPHYSITFKERYFLSRVRPILIHHPEQLQINEQTRMIISSSTRILFLVFQVQELEILKRLSRKTDWWL